MTYCTCMICRMCRSDQSASGCMILSMTEKQHGSAGDLLCTQCLPILVSFREATGFHGDVIWSRVQLALALSLKAPGADPAQTATDPRLPDHAAADAGSTPAAATPAAPLPGAAESRVDPSSKAASASRDLPDTSAGAKAAGGKGNKKRKGRAALQLEPADLQAVFAHMAAGKVTIGVQEFMQVVSQLDLDVGDDMAEAAWELVQSRGSAGACNRLDQSQFVSFVQHLATL